MSLPQIQTLEERRYFLSYAGPGPDAILWGATILTIFGTRGDDEIRVYVDQSAPRHVVVNDRVTGGIGRDLLRGGFGHDLLSGGEGNNRLRGGKGSDSSRDNPLLDVRPNDGKAWRFVRNPLADVRFWTYTL